MDLPGLMDTGVKLPIAVSGEKRTCHWVWRRSVHIGNPGLHFWDCQPSDGSQMVRKTGFLALVPNLPCRCDKAFV